MKVEQIRIKSVDALTQPQQASTAEPELGTAQPQLVSLFFIMKEDEEVKIYLVKL
jgi:hypothetical protein